MERIAAVAKQGGRLLWYPGQVDVSIRPGWFYHAAEDDKVKTLDHLLDIYYTSVGGNAQLLLNIPPDKRGRIHENDARRLKELGDRLRATFAVNLAAKAGFSRSFVLTDDPIPEPVLSDPFNVPSIASIYDLGGPKSLQCRHDFKERSPDGAADRSLRPRRLGRTRVEGDRQGNDGRLEEAPPFPGRRSDQGPCAHP